MIESAERFSRPPVLEIAHASVRTTPPADHYKWLQAELGKVDYGGRFIAKVNSKAVRGAI